jgi:hypothetical protein
MGEGPTSHCKSQRSIKIPGIDASNVVVINMYEYWDMYCNCAVEDAYEIQNRSSALPPLSVSYAVLRPPSHQNKTSKLVVVGNILLSFFIHFFLSFPLFTLAGYFVYHDLPFKSDQLSRLL